MIRWISPCCVLVTSSVKSTSYFTTTKTTATFSSVVKSIFSIPAVSVYFIGRFNFYWCCNTFLANTVVDCFSCFFMQWYENDVIVALASYYLSSTISALFNNLYANTPVGNSISYFLILSYSLSNSLIKSNLVF